jgi:hypothetical protein
MITLLLRCSKVQMQIRGCYEALSSNILAISSSVLPLVSFIKTTHVAVAQTSAPPKRKYGPDGDARRKVGAIRATVKFVIQLEIMCQSSTQIVQKAALTLLVAALLKL